MEKKEIIIIFLLALCITIFSGILTSFRLCPTIGTTCPHFRGFPFVWYRVNDYLGKDVYSNWVMFPIDALFWFLVLRGGWWVIKKLKTKK